MNRFISFEYISAQAGARRAQNVLGAQACLAGGAQLLRRESLEAIGGEIDTSSLAEDTFTTFNVQLAGRRVVFEPHAIVWAEEPRDIAGLWKQRLRWGRGNVQVTLRYRRYWLRRSEGRLGRPQLRADLVLDLPDAGADGALLGLAGDAVRCSTASSSIDVFRSLWALNLLTYLFVTLSAFAYDGPAARRSWLEAITFPGWSAWRSSSAPSIAPLAGRRCRTGCCCSPTSGCRRRCSPRTSCGASRRCRRRLARPAAAVRRRLRAAAVRDHRRGVRGRAAARGDGVGEDREDRHGRRPGVSDDFEADERFERRLFWRQLAIVRASRPC